MISKDDIIGMCDLDEDEIEAIAEHEHIPEVAAAALGDYLMHHARGAEKVHAMIVDDIRQALGRQDGPHAASLYQTLQHFLAHHTVAA
jgi:S-ribosylhomocysteine lyase LuxS involved in autoinducer biosynthesis